VCPVHPIFFYISVFTFESTAHLFICFLTLTTFSSITRAKRLPHLQPTFIILNLPPVHFSMPKTRNLTAQQAIALTSAYHALNGTLLEHKAELEMELAATHKEKIARHNRI